MKLKVIDGGYLSWVFGSSEMGDALWTIQGKRDYGDGLIIMDNPAPTIRLEMFPDYKLHRTERTDPEWLEKQDRVRRLRKYIMDDPISLTWSIPGYEADDLIACCVLYSGVDLPITIVGKDKDLLQLPVKSYRLIASNLEDDTYDRWTAFISHLQKGIQPFVKTPSDVLLYLALMGDKSDGVPRLIPPRRLDMYNSIACSSEPFREGLHQYGDAFSVNLALTILPGPFCYTGEPLQGEELVEAIHNGTYWQQELKPELSTAIRENVLRYNTSNLRGKLYRRNS